MAAMTTLAGADTAMLAETRAFNAELEARLDAEPAVHEVPVEQTRRKRREGLGPFPAPVFLDRARDMAIEGRSGRIGLRIVAPEQQAVGAYLHIHGGGWALSAADMQDPILAELADATGLCAVSVDYRLAPEHPYPAALDDCEDAAAVAPARGARASSACRRSSPSAATRPAATSRSPRCCACATATGSTRSARRTSSTAPSTCRRRPASSTGASAT